MPRLKVPCKNCEERQPHCHGKCEKYKQFQEDSAKNKEEYQKSLIWEKYRDAMIKKAKRNK